MRVGYRSRPGKRVLTRGRIRHSRVSFNQSFVLVFAHLLFSISRDCVLERTHSRQPLSGVVYARLSGLDRVGVAVKNES